MTKHKLKALIIAMCEGQIENIQTDDGRWAWNEGYRWFEFHRYDPYNPKKHRELFSHEVFNPLRGERNPRVLADYDMTGIGTAGVQLVMERFIRDLNNNPTLIDKIYSYIYG